MGDPNVLDFAPIFWSQVLYRLRTAEKAVTAGRDSRRRRQQSRQTHWHTPPPSPQSRQSVCTQVWSVHAFMCVCVSVVSTCMYVCVHGCGQYMHACMWVWSMYACMYVCVSVVNACMLWDIPDRHSDTHTHNTQSTLRHALLLDTCTGKLGTSQSLYVPYSWNSPSNQTRPTANP